MQKPIGHRYNPVSDFPGETKDHVIREVLATAVLMAAIAAARAVSPGQVADAALATQPVGSAANVPVKEVVLFSSGLIF